MTLKLCTLYKGVPYGPAHIQLIHPDGKDDWCSFEGVGLFTDGMLHQGPFTCIQGNGIALSLSMMQNGRPAENGYGTYFNGQGYKKYVYSLTEKSDVSGWQFYSGQFSNSFLHGYGKIWLLYASAFIGKFETDKMEQGELHEL